MAGSPSEAELQTQWKNLVDVFETVRAFADDTVAVPGGPLDTLEQSVKGDFTPTGLVAASDTMRAVLSSAVDGISSQEALGSILDEYGKIIDAASSYGGGYDDIASLARALYDYFVDSSQTIKSRLITYDTSATLGVSNVGNGAITRLTKDENGFDLEACTPEVKTFRGRADQNSGTRENAEVFEVLGEASSLDNLRRDAFGSGTDSNTTILSLNAGSGQSGSKLSNSSFSQFSASATKKFSGWTEAAGGAQLAQDTTNTYRTSPGTTTEASMQITGGGGTVTVKQTLADMTLQRLDPELPYFYRVMLNADVGSALGGTVTIRLGSKSASTTIAALLTNGWVELFIPADQNTYFRNFNEDAFDVEIEWSSSTSGTLLVDDAIMAPYTFIDGTWWALRGNAAVHVPWLVDDTLSFEDTGGAPADAKLQWWWWQSGLGYLPSSGTPTVTDPA
jgi:hypothetical protein